MKNKKEILVHISVWIIYAIQYTLFYPNEYIDQFGLENIAIKQFSTVLVDVIPFYINYLLLVDYFLFKRKFVQFIFLNFILLALSYLFDIFHAMLLDIYYQCDSFFLDDRKKYYLHYIMFNLLYLSMGAGVKIVVNWYREQKLRDELQMKKTEAELSFLKYQINPHFFFNTLNNIYSLSLTKPNLTSEAILHLTTQMRYILDSNKDKYNINEEIELIKSYIELQKLRVPHPEIINLKINGEGDFLIEPMILLPFIENAFKHGVINKKEKTLDIVLIVSNSEVTLKVINSKRTKKENTSSGIGLINVKRRLEIIYKDNYYLDIKEDEDVYSVFLNIKVFND